MLDAAAARATARPRLERQPTIRARLECRDRRQAYGGRIVLEVVIQERPQHMQPKILGRVAAEANLPDCTAVEPLLMMKPRPDDQVEIRIVGLLLLEGFIER